jgi:PAS domain S-box-containing protein
LPLLISGLVLAVLAVVVGAAYRIVVSTLERSAGLRALQAAQQVSGLLSQSPAQLVALVERTAPALRDYLANPTDAGLTGAREAIEGLGPSATRQIIVWNAAGEALLQLPEQPAGGETTGLPSASRPPPLGTGEIQAQGAAVFADAAVPVRGEDGQPLGVVSVRSGLSITPPDLLSRLIGSDARILFGNRSGNLWTDMTEVVPGPVVDPGVPGVQRYRHENGDERIGALAAFSAAVPWVIWVEFPRSSVVADAQSFLRNMMLLVAAVAAGAILLVRRVVTGVTGPLAEMTTAAEAMAAGNYTARVATDREDEIGRLGRAFNAMTDDVARELAARTRALDLLRASEGRYRTLFDYAPDGILIADAEGRYLDANPGICTMLGYERHELVGRQATDIVPPEETPHIAPAMAAIRADTEYQRDWRFRRRDGSMVDTEVIATLMPDGNILAMIRDVTDRNKAIEAVRTAEERMRFALESAEVGIWEMDFRSGEVRWSEILEAQHGLAAGTFGGTFEAFLAVVHPDDRDGVRRAMDDATRKGGEFALQYRVVRPDGNLRWINGAGQVLLGPARAPLRAVGISLDVTARQTLEAQFQQAQKMEAIGRLAGGVAHDFNNLLTAILGYCELVLADLRQDDLLRLEIAEIQKAGRQAAELTRQLLAFSRKQIIEPTLLDLNDVVQGLRSLLRRLISADVEIVYALADRPMMVTADRGQIEQIVMNLAVNARDAMPSGGRLTIQTAQVELDDTYAATHFRVTPGTYVALTLTDTGLGMPADVMAHLFEPFFTTKEPGKGTGLGLATVHGIVTASGGSVGVYSEVGRGTSFKVYLPRAQAGTAAALPAPQRAQVDGAGRTVLVVDDAEGLRLLMSRTLARQGFDVLLAADATEALSLVDAHPIDVLLTDVVMPGASGPELTAQVQARRPGLKVIYMSGYTEDAIVHHGVLKPGIAFLHKPFTAQALGQKIREVLGG